MSRCGENIYKRKDGRWEGRILNPGGKYRYVYAETYREVKEKKRLLLMESDQTPPFYPHASRNAAELFTAWLNGNMMNRVRPSTYESYSRCITGFVIPFYRENGHERISAQTAAEFSNRINRRQDLSAAYRKKILTIYKTSLRELLKGTSECQPVLDAIFIPKEMNKEVQIFSVKEQRMIEECIIRFENRKALGILLCFYTGIRLGEVCGLKWGDFDLEAGTMLVSRTVSRLKSNEVSGKKTYISVGKPKSARSYRKIPLPGFLLELAKKFRMDHLDEDFFILSDTLEPMDPRQYQKLFQRILKQAGVKSRKFHAIRHTFATRALELGVDIKTLSEILGHANVSITLNIYAHSMLEQKKKAIEKLNALSVMRTENVFCAVDTAVTGT